MGYLLLIVLLLWGILMFLKPDLLWRIEHTDSMAKENPTDRYIGNMRIGGIVCVVIAVVLAVLYMR